ncbi:MAG: hypothetical protein JW888_18055 [Pirellulales bacterium]|nr:hypothetical protein [Pirellulales bacterium]
MKSRWITYGDKRILYCDYTHFALSDFDELKAELDTVVALLLQEPEKSVLALTDIRGSIASRPVIAMFKRAATVTAKHVRKQAVVGVTGLKKVLFDAVVYVSRQPAKAFGDLEEEEAKDWLVEKDG